MVKFLNSSVYFNIVLAVLAAVFSILQEVWLGTDIQVLNAVIMTIAVSIGFSVGADVVKFLAFNSKFNLNNIVIGSVSGIIAGLITLLCI
jgi:hypothetical protein